MPIGTAIIAIELASSGLPISRCRSRFLNNQTAATTPSAIINPYALKRNGPISREPAEGLGKLANIKLRLVLRSNSQAVAYLHLLLVYLICDYCQATSRFGSN